MTSGINESITEMIRAESYNAGVTDALERVKQVVYENEITITDIDALKAELIKK